MNFCEVWVKFGEGGLYVYKMNVYVVVRKLKCGGYLFRIVECGFNGYMVLMKMECYESLEVFFVEVLFCDFYCVF